MRLAGLAGAALAVAAGLVGSPITGSAADNPDVDAVLFSGVTGALAPTLPPISAAPNGILQPGTYTFSGGCIAGASTDIPTDLPEVATSCNISSSGTYLNLICGTGTASGTSTVSSAADGTVSGAYTIVFVAGFGVLQNALIGNPPTTPNPGLSPEGAAVGVVDIVPSNATSGGCVTAAVSTFTVTGFTLAAG
jgi:hypothetical protein